MATAAKRRNRYRTYEGVSYTSYDGSAARQLEQGAEILQPRPLVRPRERAVARPRVQVRRPAASPCLRWRAFWRSACSRCCC